MHITSRPATAQDVNFLARIMERSMLPAQGVGLFDDLSDSISMDRIAFHEAMLVSGTSNWAQLDSFIVVELDGEPAAAAGAYDSTMPDVRPVTTSQIAALSKHLGLDREKSNALLRASIKKFGAFGDTPQFRDPGKYVVEYGAVMPEFSGHQLSRYFFGAHAKRALDLGHTTLGARALVGNNLALNTWEKMGIRHHSTLSPEQMGGSSVGIHRLVLDLANLPEGYEPGGPLQRAPRLERPLSAPAQPTLD